MASLQLYCPQIYDLEVLLEKYAPTLFSNDLAKSKINLCANADCVKALAEALNTIKNALTFPKETTSMYETWASRESATNRVLDKLTRMGYTHDIVKSVIINYQKTLVVPKIKPRIRNVRRSVISRSFDHKVYSFSLDNFFFATLVLLES